MPKDPRWSDFTRRANLRAAFDVWPVGAPLPATAEDVARGALALTLRDVVAGSAATVHLVRFAEDGVSLWLLDALAGVRIEDLVRAIARLYVPSAYAVAVVQPMRTPGDTTVRGVHVRAAHHDDLIELQGDVVGADGPLEGRSIVTWTARSTRLTDVRARWIGVPPTVDIDLPLLDAGEA